MSQSVTITRNITSSSTTTSASYIVLNTGYLKTYPGLLKAIQFMFGVVCVILLGLSNLYYGGEKFFFNMALCFMIGTFILLLSCLTSLSTGSIISKTIYEVLYHSIAGVLLLIASSIYMANSGSYSSNRSHWLTGVLGLINSILYFISAYLANKSYRGI